MTEKRAFTLGNYVTKKQLAEKLQVSELTIDRMRKKGMPWQRVGVKIIRFDINEVNQWLQKQQQQETANN